MLWGRPRASGFLLAMTLLTAIPLNVTPPRGSAPPLKVTPPRGSAPPLNVTPPGGSAPSRRAAGAAMAWAPVIGLLLGALAAAVLELASRFGHTGPLRPSETGRPIPYVDQVAIPVVEAQHN